MLDEIERKKKKCIHSQRFLSKIIWILYRATSEHSSFHLICPFYILFYIWNFSSLRRTRSCIHMRSFVYFVDHFSSHLLISFLIWSIVVSSLFFQPLMSIVLVFYVLHLLELDGEQEKGCILKQVLFQHIFIKCKMIHFPCLFCFSTSQRREENCNSYPVSVLYILFSFLQF